MKTPNNLLQPMKQNRVCWHVDTKMVKNIAWIIVIYGVYKGIIKSTFYKHYNNLNIWLDNKGTQLWNCIISCVLNNKDFTENYSGNNTQGFLTAKFKKYIEFHFQK